MLFRLGVVDGDRVGDGVDVGGEGGAVLAVDQEGGPGEPAQVGRGSTGRSGVVQVRLTPVLIAWATLRSRKAAPSMPPRSAIR